MNVNTVKSCDQCGRGFPTAAGRETTCPDCARILARHAASRRRYSRAGRVCNPYSPGYQESQQAFTAICAAKWDLIDRWTPTVPWIVEIPDAMGVTRAGLLCKVGRKMAHIIPTAGSRVVAVTCPVEDVRPLLKGNSCRPTPVSKWETRIRSRAREWGVTVAAKKLLKGLK